MTTADVNNLLKQFKQVQQMMKGMGGGMQGQGKGKKGKRGRSCPMGDLPGLPGALDRRVCTVDSPGRPMSAFRAFRRTRLATVPKRSLCWPSRSV